MIEATLCYLIRRKPTPAVLLGFKKIGFGKGKLDGIGGKLEPGETAAQAAVREVTEETGVRIKTQDLVPVGDVRFLFPASREMEHHVYLFLARRWKGEPRETEEILPAWVPMAAIPWQKMWADAVHWLPRVLEGQDVRGEITFNPNNESVAAVDLEWVEGGPGSAS